MSAFNIAYIGRRPDIMRLIPPGVKNVLDVGCATGVLGEEIQRTLGARVTGIELDPAMFAEARQKIHRAIQADIENLDFEATFGEERFDCVIFADLLEHLRDPWRILIQTRRILTPDGVVLTSIPNVRHISVLINLIVFGRWPYRDRGINDRTHLRFFTEKNIREMFAGAGLEIEKMERTLRIIERPHRYNAFARYFNLPGLRAFLTFQYLIRARAHV